MIGLSVKANTTILLLLQNSLENVLFFEKILILLHKQKSRYIVPFTYAHKNRFIII